MDKEEFSQTVEDIEQNEELTDAPNDLTEEELESLEDDYEDPDDEEYEDVTRTETITIVKQPIVTSVIVGAEVDSKGQIKPMCKVSIERHLDPDEFGNSDVEIDEFDVIKNDFTELASEVSMQIAVLKKELNK